MSSMGTYDSKRYGTVDISYVSTGINCGYWIAKQTDGTFICTADSYEELVKTIEEGQEG